MVRRHADELAQLLTAENGKPLSQSRYADVESCIGSLEFFDSQIGEPSHAVHDLGAIAMAVLLEP